MKTIFHTIIAATVLIAFTAMSAIAQSVPGRTLVLEFKGEAEAGVSGFSESEMRALLGDDGFDELMDEFACFEAPMIDPGRNFEVGVGVDCFRPLELEDETAAAAGLLAVETQAFFLLPGGSFTSSGLTSLAPFLDGYGDAGVTHLTGSFPEGANITAANGGFSDQGTVRLSGGVDLNRLEDGVLVFNCIWVVQFEGPAQRPFNRIR